MSRFAAGLHKLKDVAGRPAPVTAETEPETKIGTPRAPSRQGKVAVAAYFDPAVRKQLAILAVKEERSQAALLAEAMNLLFERYGEPPIARA